MDAPREWYERYNSEAQSSRSQRRSTPARRERLKANRRRRREALFARDGWRCVVPGCELTDLTRDHVVPRSKRGGRGGDQFQTLCGYHNAMKGDMSQAEFQALLGVSW